MKKILATLGIAAAAAGAVAYPLANNSVGGAQIINGSVSEAEFSAAVKAKLAKPVVVTILQPDTTIVKVGGPWVANHTQAPKRFVLTPGTWRIVTNSVINRTVAGLPTDEAVRPQVAVRGAGGQDGGTAMGIEISKTVGRELLLTSTKRVTITANTIFTVNYFAYTDTGGSTDSGNLVASSETTAEKVG